MNDLFKKINVLLQSQINDLVDNRDVDDRDTAPPRRRRLNVKRLGGNVDGELGQLRTRVDQALAYESELQAHVDKLYAKVNELDQKADAAVLAGRDADARFAVRQLKETQRQLNFLESDLREHRRITQELLSKVNMLEATVEEARRSEAAETPAPPADDIAADEPVVTSIPVTVIEEDDETMDDAAPTAETQPATPPPEKDSAQLQVTAATGDSLSDILKKTRETVDELVANAPDMSTDILPDTGEPDEDDADIDDDLQSRVSRLTKPKK